MKTVYFKRILLCFLLPSLIFTSCTDEYDDEEIWDKVNELEERIEELEKTTKQLNTNITSLQTLVTALEKNLYIVSADPMSSGRGYNIKLSNNTTIPIYHGTDGSDGNTPIIGLVKDVLGDYYWTVNGETLKDEDGNPIRANGKDGSNGSSTPTPMVKTGSQLEEEGIEGEEDWQPDAVYISVDDGESWTKISADYIEPDLLFDEVNINEDYVEFILTDGTIFTIPLTDQTLAALYGTWEGKNKAGDKIILTLDDDNKYKYESEEEDIDEEGSFEYFPSRYMFVLYDVEGEDRLYTVLKIVDDKLHIIENGNTEVLILELQN